MSLAKKCDRCHTYFEDVIQGGIDDINYALVGLKNKNGDWKQNEHYDLCPKCGQELKEWLTYPEYTSVTVCRHTPMGTTNKIDPDTTENNKGEVLAEITSTEEIDIEKDILEHNCDIEILKVDPYNGKEIKNIIWDRIGHINTYYYTDGTSRRVGLQIEQLPTGVTKFREVNLDEGSK